MRWRTRLLPGGAALRYRASTADTVLYWHHGSPARVMSDGHRPLAVLGGADEGWNSRQCTVPAGVRHTVVSDGDDPVLWSEASVPGRPDWAFDDEVVGPSRPADGTRSEPGTPRPPTVEAFDLTEHIEGGYFRQLWESGQTLRTSRGERTLANTILYLLDRRSPVGRLHLNLSDITHFAHGSGVVDYLLVAPDGSVHQQQLGVDVTRGQVPAFTVRGGWWKASRLAEGQEEALISEIAAPGFVFEDQRLARVSEVPELFPDHVDRVLPYAFG
ncbi:cupin domain-containing protein [Umezawaea tangerina]|nr:cupin domain-containing protein [Umezawaea tangerina]